MADAEHPTIPQIVRALTTLHDRHSDALKVLREEHRKELKQTRERLETVDDILLGRDCLVEALENVIAGLCLRVQRTQEQLQKDNTQCTYSEPLELMNLLGRSFDPSELIANARTTARAAKKEELKRQDVERIEREMIESGSTKCQCGKWWRSGSVPAPGHTVEECFRPCRVCGHHEDRHTEELPEEGGKNYCAECTGTVGPFVARDHTYDGAICAEWDVCRCGHSRKEHARTSPVGAYCNACRPNVGRKHEFALKH